MPAQTVIQVRRDTAANWSSTNPTLASGEMGYDTTNKLFKVGDGSTAWNSLKVMAQQNTGSAARPLLTDGAYLDGSTGLVLTGLTANYASAPDSAALSITGDIDIKVKATAISWKPSASQTFAAKYTTGTNQRSYWFYVNNLGNFVLVTSADGTNALTHTSSAANAITDGTSKWVRATMQVNDGAGNRLVKFYTSDNGTTWTQLGTTVTTAGTTSIFDGTAVLEAASTSAGTANLLIGTVARVIIQSAYDTADNTTSLAFDANFATQTADALAFTESSSNAATVTVNTSRYRVGIPDVEWQGVATSALGTNRTNYAPFVIDSASVIDMAVWEVTTGPSSTDTFRVAIYAATADFQPTGTPVVDFGSTSIPSGSGGVAVYQKQVTPVTLQPGAYLIACRTDNGFTARRFMGGLAYARTTLGTNPFDILYFRSSQTGNFGSAVAWNDSSNSSIAAFHFVLLRWKAA